MKKIILLTSCALMPFAAFATDLSDARFFIEYDQAVYSSITTKLKAEGYTLFKGTTNAFNQGGAIALGVDINGIQLAVVPSYSDDEDGTETAVSLRLDLPFMTGNIQPFMSVHAGIDYVDIDDVLDDTGFSYGVAFGVKYSFNDNTYIKGSVGYTAATLSSKVEGLDVDMDANGFVLMTGLGYRF